MSEQEQTRIEDRLNYRSLDNFFRFNVKCHKAILAQIENPNETEFIPNNIHIIDTESLT